MICFHIAFSPVPYPHIRAKHGQTTAFSLPLPAVSGCHHEAAAGFRRVNSQLCFLLSRYICPLMCVYHIYHEAVTTSGPMTTSGKELTPLVLHCTPPPHLPTYLLLLSSALTTTSGSNQSVTSELRCNKSQPLRPPLYFFFFPCLFFSLLFLSWLFSGAGLSSRKPQGSSRPLHPPSCLHLGEGQPHFLAASLPHYKPKCIYLAHLCRCVINT